MQREPRNPGPDGSEFGVGAGAAGGAHGSGAADAGGGGEPPGTAGPGSASDSFGPRERLAIWLLLGSCFIAVVNETVMGVATAPLMREFAISAAQAQWLTTAFMLTMSIIIPMTGLVIQRFSTRTLFIVSTAVFTLGTLIAAAAPGFSVLLLGRVVQAAGTAVLSPLVMTTVATVAPPGQRGRLLGQVSVVFASAPAFGPVLAGFVLQWLSWRWLFFIMLPIAVVVLVVGGRLMPSVGVRRHARIDVFSIALAGFAFGGIVYGLSAVGSLAAGAPTLSPWVPLAVGVVGLLAFGWRQRVLQRADRALLDLRVFAQSTFARSTVVFVASSISLFGVLFLLPLYAQNVLGFSPLVTGLIVLPGSIVSAALAPLVGRIVDARGGRRVLIAGTAVTALSLWSMLLFGEHTPLAQLFATNLLMNIGLAGVFTPIYAMALGSLPPRLASHGSATLNTVQQLAAAAGTALLVTLMTVFSVRHGGLGLAESAESMVVGLRVAFFTSATIATVGVGFALAVRDRPGVFPERQRDDTDET
ncbi:MDR family MFS transporter [Leucobacter albus]|uniref:MDR family MFS transporter n=1 Tax=Leucobacter albus TaxID=272210 RepID=A0ABW3TR21_9MICO